MQQFSKKILILYTSVGLGHKSIAENIGFYLREAGLEVKLADIGSVQKGAFEKVVVGTHQFINKYLPFIWGWLYNWGHYIILPFRVFIAGFNYKQAQSFIDEFDPDLIISTQTTSSAVVAYLKQKGLYKNLFAIAFSDYHLHPYWLYRQADFYLVNIEEQKRQMMAMGMPEKKVFVCGITLKPKLEVNVAAIKLRLNIAEDEKVVLLASGSQGLGVDKGLIEQFINQPKLKVLVLCGKNREIYEKLNQKFAGSSATILGFYSPLDELYAIADIFITKPGGLSIAESLSWNLPIIISHLLPGQERYNYEYLLKQGLVMPQPENLVQTAQIELSRGNFKTKLASNRHLYSILKGGQELVKVVKQALDIDV